MAKNYDNYGYDDNGKNSPGLIRRILIVVMVIIAIILILYLITSCTKSNKKPVPENNTTNKVDYEGEILTAGKKYFETHNEDNPTAPGECSLVELETLVDEKLIDANKFNNCNQNTTYLKQCVLEDGRKQYTPWISCVGYSSETLYGLLNQGTSKDIISDKTYVEFKFVPQELTKAGEILGDVETYWKNDIPYEKYKTLSSTKYYRYRDKLYQWSLVRRTYYSMNGATEDASKVKDLYVSSPSSAYKNKGEKATAYKWYTSSGTKEYYKKNGSKYPSPTAIEGYPYRDPKGIDVTRYRTRTVTGTYAPTLYYVCATSASGTKWIYQTVKCGTGNNPQYNYTRETIYSCANEANGALVRANTVNKNAVCKKYSEWSSPTSTKCDTTKTDICQSTTITFYYWYKLVNEVRKYLPSYNTNPDKVKVYYTSAPVSGAIKDESTKTTAYKWYKEVTSTSTKYTALPPSGYSKSNKSSDYKWTDWSDWDKKDPKAKDGRDRVIETQTKIKLQEIKGTTTDGWQNLSTDYLSEENLIKLFKEKGYNITTLEDITNNGQIKYQLITYVRNKKESK